jgi:hypothetical protein
MGRDTLAFEKWDAGAMMQFMYVVRQDKGVFSGYRSDGVLGLTAIPKNDGSPPPFLNQLAATGTIDSEIFTL